MAWMWFTSHLIKRGNNIKEAIGDTLGVRPHTITFSPLDFIHEIRVCSCVPAMWKSKKKENIQNAYIAGS